MALILIVDDSPTRCSSCRALEKHGFKTAAENGEEGVRKAKR